MVKAIWTAVGQHDLAGDVVTTKGKPEADSSLRGTENVPLSDDIEEYFAREVLPHVPDAWIDHDKTKTGYEIPFTRLEVAVGTPLGVVRVDRVSYLRSGSDRGGPGAG